MEKIYKQKIELYLFVVTVLFFFPLGMLIGLLAYIKRKSVTPSTYFTDVKKRSSPRGQWQNIFVYSELTWLTLIILTPCIWLGRRIIYQIFLPSKRLYRATPNQAASIVISQIMGNMRGIAATADNLKAQYIVALQPTLMDTGAITKDDEAIIKRRKETILWGFSYTRFYESYYAKLRGALKNDPRLKNSFLDVSRIFVDTKEQRLIDVVHMGNKGQEEMAEKFADEIFRRSS